ncbi:MAG: metal ABC transporter permease [Gemmatimonadetes bacterium]|nr:metal ABC transporter permease [Gemmatimonadota bacterium]
MNVAILFDSLFLVPFINGLLLALQLPLLGAYSRMRGEWLASLGVAQAAAAGLLLGAFVGAPTAGALLTAAVAAIAKTLLGRRSGNDAYAVMLLVGWSGALLLAANTARGEDLSRALLEGQLYFTGPAELRGLSVLLGVTLVTLWWLSRFLLLRCLLPDRLTGDGGLRRWHDLVRRPHRRQPGARGHGGRGDGRLCARVVVSAPLRSAVRQRALTGVPSAGKLERTSGRAGRGGANTFTVNRAPAQKLSTRPGLSC